MSQRIRTIDGEPPEDLPPLPDSLEGILLLPDAAAAPVLPPRQGQPHEWRQPAWTVPDRPMHERPERLRLPTQQPRWSRRRWPPSVHMPLAIARPDRRTWMVGLLLALAIVVPFAWLLLHQPATSPSQTAGRVPTGAPVVSARLDVRTVPTGAGRAIVTVTLVASGQAYNGRAAIEGADRSVLFPLSPAGTGAFTGSFEVVTAGDDAIGRTPVLVVPTHSTIVVTTEPQSATGKVSIDLARGRRNGG